MMNITVIVKRVYKELWLEKRDIPDITELYDRVSFEVMSEYSDEISAYYLKNGFFGDYHRVMTSGVITEDMNGEIDYFDKFEVMNHLDNLMYTYRDKHKIFNEAQRPVFF